MYTRTGSFRTRPHRSRPGRMNGRVTGRTSMTITVALVVSMLVVSALAVPLSPVFAKSEPAHAAANLPPVNVNNGFADLVQAVKPAVVNISVTGHVTAKRNVPGLGQQSPELEEFFRRFFGEVPEGLQRDPKSQPYERKTTAVGSGFIIDPQGLVVTNNHVIEDADEIEVVFDDGTRIPATLKGRDKKSDLALLKITTDKPLPYVIFGDSDSARVGDWVVAIGNPFGLGGTTTSGIVSARGRDINAGPLDDFIQIDAPINRGNSGGPLFNTKGEVIGINSAIFSPNGGSIGIGFAIPSSMASNVISQLRDSGIVQRGYLGVHIQTVSEEISDSLGLEKAYGALVTRVVEESPAERAGIEAGDIILTYNGKEVSKMRDLPKLVALTTNETEVDLEVWRNDERHTLKVSIGSNKEESMALEMSSDKSKSGTLGLSVGTLNSENREKYGFEDDVSGVVVTDIDPNGAAAQRGLREGDIIKRIDKKQISSPDDVKQAIKTSRDSDKKSVLLLVERDKQVRFIVVPMNS